jgi:paraquat-inducible protein A
MMIGEASLDRRRIWRAILPGVGTPRGERTIGCDICDLVVLASEAGKPCPRCTHRLSRRKPDALGRTTALTFAALVLYAPAYFLPMTHTVQPGEVMHRTILDGVYELFSKGFWYLGVILFTVSVAIPFLKLASLTWFVLRVKFPRRIGLVLRTKIHRIIHRINRWSFVDPFIVALTAPLMSYPGIADVHAGPGALPFALVVVLTMLASRFFDNRLMWDAVRETDD